MSISGLIALVVGLAAGAGPATEVPFLFRVFFVCNKGEAKEVNEEGVAKFGLASWWCWVWRSRCWAAVPRPRCWAWRAQAPQPQCWVIRRHGNGGSAEGESAMGVSCRAVNLFILILMGTQETPELCHLSPLDFHLASIQKVARTTYRGNTCKCLIASKRLRMQKKSCTCNFLKSCRCNFF